MKLGLIIFVVSIAIFLILILCKNNKNNQDNYEANNESCKNKVGGYCDCSGNVYDCSGVCGGENKPSDNGCCPNVEDLGCGCGDDPTKAIPVDPSTNCCPDVKDSGCGCGDDPTKAIPVDPSSNCCQNVTDLGCGCGDDHKTAINPNKCGGCEQDKDCKDNQGNPVECGNAGGPFPQWADCSGNLINCDGSQTVEYSDCEPKVCKAPMCIGCKEPCDPSSQESCEYVNVKCNCVPDNSKGQGDPMKPTFGYNCR